MENYGERNVRNIKRTMKILNVVLVSSMVIVFISSLFFDGLLSFFVLLAQTILMTLLYETFKSYVQKSIDISERYESLYQKTLVYQTNLNFLKRQLTDLLSAKMIDLPSLLFYIQDYAYHVNQDGVYDDASLALFNSYLKEYSLHLSDCPKAKVKKYTLQLIEQLYDVHEYAKQYLYTYYKKTEKAIN